jgi:hypothetical protein
MPISTSEHWAAKLFALCKTRQTRQDTGLIFMQRWEPIPADSPVITKHTIPKILRMVTQINRSLLKFVVLSGITRTAALCHTWMTYFFYHNINIILTHARINTINFAGQMDFSIWKHPRWEINMKLNLNFGRAHTIIILYLIFFNYLFNKTLISYQIINSIQGFKLLNVF